MSFKTEQEIFWTGNFGDEYVQRNQGEGYVSANVALFSKIFHRIGSVKSVIEFGANIGINLVAIKKVVENINLSAVEINKKAVLELQKIEGVRVYHSSILDYEPENIYDFVLVKGVLIHINPNELQSVYEKLYQSSSQYIFISEYYNPTPVEVTYRGHEGKLFKRDFAGEMLDKYPDLDLVDYGFIYRRDKHYAQDDQTWFLLKKIGV